MFGVVDGCLWSFCNWKTHWNYSWREGNFFPIPGFCLAATWLSYWKRRKTQFLPSFLCIMVHHGPFDNLGLLSAKGKCRQFVYIDALPRLEKFLSFTYFVDLLLCIMSAPPFRPESIVYCLVWIHAYLPFKAIIKHTQYRHTSIMQSKL